MSHSAKSHKMYDFVNIIVFYSKVCIPQFSNLSQFYGFDIYLLSMKKKRLEFFEFGVIKKYKVLDLI